MAAWLRPLIGSGTLAQAATCFAIAVAALMAVALALQWLFGLLP